MLNHTPQPSSHFDLGDWLLRHAPPQKKLSSAEWECDCPRCGKSGKLAINVVKQAWQCWTCEFRGYQCDALVAAYLNVDRQSAKEIVAQASIGFSNYVEALQTKKPALHRVLPQAPIPPGTKWILDGEALAYARRRGVSSTDIVAFGLSSVSGDGTRSIADRLLRGRLLIPIWIGGIVVFWVARDTTGRSKIKVVNLPASAKHESWGLSLVPNCAQRNDVLVGMHLVTSGDPICLVEGPLDALVCGAGFVSSLGSRLSLQQARLIAAAKPSEVTILYDGDEAGRKGAIQAYALLSAFVSVKIAHCPEGLDPADLGRNDCIALSLNAVGKNFVRGL